MHNDEMIKLNLVQSYTLPDGTVVRDDLLRYVRGKDLPKDRITYIPRDYGDWGDPEIMQWQKKFMQASLDHRGAVATGTCFFDAIDFLSLSPFAADLYHAKGKDKGSGKIIYHAWVEQDGFLIDSTYFKGSLFWMCLPKAMVGKYRPWVPLRQIRYSKKQALAHGTLGPWAPFMLEGAAEETFGDVYESCLKKNVNRLKQLPALAG